MGDAAGASVARVAATVEIQVQFYDLDPLHIVWHGHYAKFLEQARCALLDVIGYNYREMEASGYSWPVIDLHLRYAQPATFGQRIAVRAELVEWENRLKIEYVITDVASGARLTKGSTTQVAVDMATQQMQFVSPAILFQKLGLPAL
jgi:acyl-CoA thioester hydrolase